MRTSPGAVAVLAFGLMTASASVHATLVSIDIGGKRSISAYGNVFNDTLTIVLPANAHVTGIGWDVSLTSDAPSWLSEVSISFESSSTLEAILVPGVDDDFLAPNSYTSGGIADLIAFGLDFFVLADGVLRLEFYESFDDAVPVPDAVWAGTLTVQYADAPVPLPAAAWLLDFGPRRPWIPASPTRGARRRRKATDHRPPVDRKSLLTWLTAAAAAVLHSSRGLPPLRSVNGPTATGIPAHPPGPV